MHQECKEAYRKTHDNQVLAFLSLVLSANRVSSTDGVERETETRKAVWLSSPSVQQSPAHYKLRGKCMPHLFPFCQ